MVEVDGKPRQDISSDSSLVITSIADEVDKIEKYLQTQVGVREAPATDKEVKLNKHANDGLATPYFSFSSSSSVSSYPEVMVCH